MTTGAAIAAVTEMIRRMLQDHLPDLAGALGQKPGITAVPPDRIQTGGQEADQLNVFMYKADPNPGWRNQGLPTRSAGGARIAQPPLALDLHYLVSAYTKNDLHADLLLGHAMQVLYGVPVITAAMIEDQFGNAAPADVPGPLWSLLQSSGLGDQVEQVTLTMQTQSNDDISKLWSVLGEKYRPSAAYLVTVVLIQPEGPARTALPVIEPPDLVSLPSPVPRVSAVDPADAPWAVGLTLTVEGSNLVGQSTRVVVGATDVQPEPGGTAQRLRVVLPAGTRAGTQRVRVRHLVEFSSGTTTTLQQSNAVSVVVRPVVGVTEVLAPAGQLPRRLRAALEPDIGEDQAVDLLLNNVADPQVGFTIASLPRSGEASGAQFDVEAVPAGDYLLQVRVDGAASELQQGAASFDAPVVTI